ncbi:MAG: zinc-ribbon domain-containing protein [Acidobacteria bacterium]|nr:zinc-ribbon domain-containing protein [Acidobacteriota bacterium]
MYCKKCGARIPDEHTRFCPSCGEPVVHEKLGPSNTEKGLWVVIGIIILIAAFVLLRNKTSSNAANTISTPQLNVNSNTVSDTKRNSPRLRREVSAPPSPSASSITPVQTPSSLLYASLAEALKGSRYSLEVKYVNQLKAFRVSASVLYDNQPRETYLNIFSRFFAICYGGRSRPLISATISLKQGDGKPMMAMGIGRKTAGSVPAVTWRQFSDMGTSLVNWVRNHEVKNPPSPEMACYFKQNAEF